MGAARSTSLRQGAIKIRNNIVVLSILCFSTACAQTELVDAQLREAGLRLGAASVALTQLPVDAPPDAFEESSRMYPPGLQSLTKTGGGPNAI